MDKVSRNTGTLLSKFAVIPPISEKEPLMSVASTRRAPQAVGIDIAKDKFDICLLFADDTSKTGTYANNAKGWQALHSWLENHGAAQTPVCMEATGRSYEQVASFCREQGHPTHVVNPAWIKRFAEATGTRTKTDKADALLIARYCLGARPELWRPPSPLHRELKELCRLRTDLVAHRVAHANASAEATHSTARDMQTELAKECEARIKKVEGCIRKLIAGDKLLRQSVLLLQSIPGVGLTTAAAVIAETDGLLRFDTASAVVAYTGLSPAERSSGSSVRGRSRISKKGNGILRKALYWPGITAMRVNPAVKALAERLEAKGKLKKVVICACMKKLVQLMFGVLKHGQPFDKNYKIRQSAQENRTNGSPTNAVPCPA